MPPFCPIGRRVLIWLLAASSALAASDDLNRLKPVASDRPIPAWDFLRPPLVSDVRMNCSGDFLAAAVLAPDSAQIHYEGLLYDLANHRALRVPSAWDVSQLIWVTRDELYLGLPPHFAGVEDWAVERGGYYIDVASLSWTGRNRNDDLRFLRQHPPGRIWPDITEAVPGDWPQLPPGVALASVVDHLTGLPAAVAVEQRALVRWYWLDDGRWTASPFDPSGCSFVGPSDRRGEVLVNTPARDGHPGPVRRLALATGTLGASLGGDPDYTCDGVVFSPDGRRIAGLRVKALYPKTLWLDAGFARAQEQLFHTVRGGSPVILDGAESGRRFLAAVVSARCPPVYYVADFGRHSFSPFMASAPWIAPARTRSVIGIRYKSRDGLMLDATLLLPPGTSKVHPAPLIVVLADGGTGSRFVWGWNAAAQLFGQWGYAVLCPNDRAGAGLSWQVSPRESWNLIHRQDDIVDGVEHLIGSGLIDARAVALVGTGLGAGRALSLCERRPDLFQAVVVSSAICDLSRYVRESSVRPSWVDEAIDYLGDPGANPAAYAPLDPLQRIDALKAPVCMIDPQYFDPKDDAQMPELDRILSQHRCLHAVLHGSVAYEQADAEEQTNRIYDSCRDFLARQLRH